MCQNRPQNGGNEMFRGVMSSAGGPEWLKMTARAVRIIVATLFGDCGEIDMKWRS